MIRRSYGKMKRLMCVCLVVALACMSFAGCEKNAGGREKEITSEKKTVNEEFCFNTANGIIKVNMNAESALKIAGEYKDYFEMASCAFNGLDKIYMYSGFEIYVNEIDGVELVTRIVLTDDSVMTKEGLYIGAGLDRMVDLYGNDFEHSQGMYVYQKGSTKLIVGVAAEDVVSLEYAGTYGK